jgi:(p)ppGpp synthase/HD superfamily hydrolase
MPDENSVIAALLHDVIEDCGEAYADIIRREFSAEIAEAVETLTKREDLAYDVYIEAVKNNPIARRVKIADLTHNMNLSRIGATEETLTEYQRERLEKYRHSLQYLLENSQEDRT